MARKDLIIILSIYLLATGYYLFRMLQATPPGFPLDDSWIHQVFARNIATGHGFSFNPDHPIAGATAPLWTLVLTVFWVVFGPVGGGMLAGVVFQMVGIAGVYFLARNLTSDRVISFLTALFSALCWPLIWGGLSGMEVGLYTALTIWGLYFYFRSGDFDDYRYYVSYLLFTLAFLSRPECGLFLAAAILRDIGAWIKAGRRPFYPWIVRLAIIAVLILPYFLFNFKTVGSLLPQTFTAKIQHKGFFSVLLSGDAKRIIKTAVFFPFHYLTDFYHQALTTINPLLVLALAPGVYKLVKFGNAQKNKIVILVLLFVLYAPLMGAVSPMVSATFQNYRLVANLLPLLMLFGTAGLFWRKGASRRSSLRLLLFPGIGFLVAAISFALIFPQAKGVLASLVVQEPSRMGQSDYVNLRGMVEYVRYGTTIVGVILISGWAYGRFRIQRLLAARSVRAVLIVLTLAASVTSTVAMAGLYAHNVRNINERDVAAGLFLRWLKDPVATVAANDVGAIGYYSGMMIFDLKGLISPELTPEMIQNDSLAFEYMFSHRRVDYLAIAPEWFNYIPRRTDIFLPMAMFQSEFNTIVAGDSTVIYKAVWPEVTP